MMVTLVSRGSQFQYTPQVGLAQIDPSSTPMVPNTRLTSAPASASASAAHEARNRYQSDAPKFSREARSIIHTEGTWTYMMRATSPMSRSAGTHASPSQEPLTSSS